MKLNDVMSIRRVNCTPKQIDDWLTRWNH